MEIKIDGMSCQGCIDVVTETLADVEGVERVTDVSLENGTAEVEGDPAPEALVQAVEAVDYDARVF